MTTDQLVDLYEKHPSIFRCFKWRWCPDGWVGYPIWDKLFGADQDMGDECETAFGPVRTDAVP